MSFILCSRLAFRRRMSWICVRASRATRWFRLIRTTQLAVRSRLYIYIRYSLTYTYSIPESNEPHPASLTTPRPNCPVAATAQAYKRIHPPLLFLVFLPTLLLHYNGPKRRGTVLYADTTTTFPHRIFTAKPSADLINIGYTSLYPN